MVERTGSLLTDSQRPGTRGVAYGDRPEIAAALAGRTVQGRRRSDTLDQELLYTAVPVINGGRTVAPCASPRAWMRSTTRSVATSTR